MFSLVVLYLLGLLTFDLGEERDEDDPYGLFDGEVNGKREV